MPTNLKRSAVALALGLMGAALYVTGDAHAEDAPPPTSTTTTTAPPAPDHGPVPTTPPTLSCTTTVCTFAETETVDGLKISHNHDDPWSVGWWEGETSAPPGTIVRVRQCVGPFPYDTDLCGPAAEAVVPAPTDFERYHATGSINGYPCGGDLPPCWVLDRESHGNPTAENPRSTASGLWQFLDSTWAGYGGYSHASHAPPSVQNAKAAALWNHGAGCSHWSACR